MKKIFFITIFCVFVSTPSWGDWFAGVDNLEQTNTVGTINYTYGSGGEFTISDSDLNIGAYVLGVTSGITGDPNSFQTFCVETTESIATPVDVVVNESGSPITSFAIAGGGGLNPDPLDPRTAYLYTQFAKGVLSGYDYDNTGVGRSSSADSLQKAIWFIEDEISSVSGQAAIWVTEAGNAISTSAWSGIGQVRILNIYAQGTYGTTNELKQDQLYLIPVPGAFLLGILGLGAAGIKLRRFA